MTAAPGSAAELTPAAVRQRSKATRRMVPSGVNATELSAVSGEVAELLAAC